MLFWPSYMHTHVYNTYTHKKVKKMVMMKKKIILFSEKGCVCVCVD